MSTPPPHRLARLVAPVAVGLALVLAGCGGSDGDQSARATTSAAAPVASSDTAAVDAAFVREMIPHHRLAIQMAGYAATRAKHADLKALAQRIATTQRDEVSELEAAAKRLDIALPAGDGMPGMDEMHADAATLGIAAMNMGMSMDTTSLATAKPFDLAFLVQMIPHHQGAIAMARAEVTHGGDAELKSMAAGIAATQNAENIQMAKWRVSWYPSR